MLVVVVFEDVVDGDATLQVVQEAPEQVGIAGDLVELRASVIQRSKTLPGTGWGGSSGRLSYLSARRSV